MIITDQKMSEVIPKTLLCDTLTGCGSLGLKTVWTVYSGLVPMSPKTTPRAPSASAAWAPARRPVPAVRPVDPAGRHAGALQIDRAEVGEAAKRLHTGIRDLSVGQVELDEPGDGCQFLQPGASVDVHFSCAGSPQFT